MPGKIESTRGNCGRQRAEANADMIVFINKGSVTGKNWFFFKSRTHAVSILLFISYLLTSSCLQKALYIHHSALVRHPYTMDHRLRFQFLCPTNQKKVGMKNLPENWRICVFPRKSMSSSCCFTHIKDTLRTMYDPPLLLPFSSESEDWNDREKNNIHIQLKGAGQLDMTRWNWLSVLWSKYLLLPLDWMSFIWQWAFPLVCRCMQQFSFDWK